MTEYTDLDWSDDHGPRSPEFGDVYFSAEDGLAETRHVFLDGVGLPDAWLGRRQFVIGETGFGTGLNFLAAWDLWRRTPGAPERLHFLTTEAHPVRPDDIRRAHDRWPELSPLSAQLADAAPPPTAGFHRRHFEDGRLVLTILHGDAAAMLESATASVDAWFLDGFSPERNPDMWTPALFDSLYQLSAPGARLASFTAAGAVRRGLADAGFDIERRPGFGRKRHMTVGARQGASHPGRPPPVRASIRAPIKDGNRGVGPWGPPPPSAADPGAPSSAIIIGAGVAGCAMARSLTQRGWATTIIDRQAGPANGASGNPAALIKPRAYLDDSPWTLFTFSAHSYARHVVDLLERSAGKPGAAKLIDQPLASWCGALELAMGQRELYRQETLASWRGASRHMCDLVSADEGGDLAGLPIRHPGRWYPDAGMVSPVRLCERAVGADTTIIEATAGSVRHEPGEGRWTVFRADGSEIAAAPVLILATGAGGVALTGNGLRHRFGPGAHPALMPARGRVTELAANTRSCRLRSIVVGDGYITPAIDDRHIAGASYARLSLKPESVDDSVFAALMDGHGPDASSHEDDTDDLSNRARICASVPDLGSTDDLAILGGRTGIRVTTRDRRPLVGPFSPPGQTAPAGLYTLSAMGSRGYSQAWLLADLLASHLAGEPLPLPHDQIAATAPGRFDIFAPDRW